MVVKISVLSNGDILEDDHKVTFEQIATRLKEAKAANGAVWYYREAAGNDPPANAMKVMKLVVENRLPITLSTKPDFSDFVDMDGKAHPRKP
jgi:hypothetical protein